MWLIVSSSYILPTFFFFFFKEGDVCVLSCSVMSDFLWPHGLYSFRLLCSWNFLDKYTGVGCHFLLQWIFPIQGSNPHHVHILHWQAILYTSTTGKPKKGEKVKYKPH